MRKPLEKFSIAIWDCLVRVGGEKNQLWRKRGTTPHRCSLTERCLHPLPLRDGLGDLHLCLDHNREPTMLPGAARTGWQGSDGGCARTGGVGVRG